MMRVTLGLSGDLAQTFVERALAEFRAGRPVLIAAGSGDSAGAALVMAVEGLGPDVCARLDGVAQGHARLVLPAGRLRRLGCRERAEAGAIALPQVLFSRIEALALTEEARLDAPVCPILPVDQDALSLASLALVLPATVVLPVGEGVEVDPSVLRVTGDAIRAYAERKARDIGIVSRAAVPLEGAPDSEFVVFRGGEGLRDQVAVIVGHPDLSAPVDVRLHSACLTGDLFGSLKCDCGDQLREAVRLMAAGDGGVLLYLDQEGRGTGIANKIRAYKLQAKGYDTYDADEVLGFGFDQRRFGFAAEMLRQLGVTRVRLLTNNPDKISALRHAGIEVTSDQRLVGRRTAENVHYLLAKRDRAGHLLDLGGRATSSSND